MRTWILPLSLAVGLPTALSLALIGCNGDGDDTPAEANCVDEIDNDNDGVTDCDDPDCAATLACDNDTGETDTDTDTDTGDTGVEIPTLLDATSVITGEDDDDWAGFSIASGGDINGDGNNDLIVGAPKRDCKDAAGNTLVDSGAAYVVFGPITDNVSLGDADITICGGRADAQLGYSVALSGDMTGDGNDDIIVAAPRESAGRVFLFSGLEPSSDPYIADLRAEPSPVTIDVVGEGIEYHFGYALTIAPPDRRVATPALVVGSDAYSDERQGDMGSNLGRTYLFDTPLDPAEEQYRASRASTTFTGAAAREDSGGSVAIGDWDGDGENDIAVGASRAANNGDAGAGVVYVKYGDFSDRKWTLDQVDVEFRGRSSAEAVGHKVADAGDLNDDGVNDLVVAALTAGNENGSVYVWYGSFEGWTSGDSTTVDMALNGDKAFDRAGHGVDGVGDVTADGVDDIVVGAIGVDLDGLSERGAVYVISGADGLSGGNDLPAVAYQTYLGTLRDELAGHRVVGVGDITGDDRDDFVVGAYRSGASGDDSGAVYLISGPVSSGK